MQLTVIFEPLIVLYTCQCEVIWERYNLQSSRSIHVLLDVLIRSELWGSVTSLQQ